MSAQKTWHAVDVKLAAAAREAVEYALMEAGALGSETTDEDGLMARVTAYFADAPDQEHVRACVDEALQIYDLPTSFVSDVQLREVAGRDWLGEWKKSWQPVAIGKRFIIAPPWSEVANEPDRIVIRIEPGMAFGTGTHETTRLCIAAIEKYFKGASFLDVGTGTGILSIAAAKLQTSARIEACDVDAEAIAIARENAMLNGLENEHIRFRVGTIDDSTTSSADCVCANLTADVIVPLLPALISATCGRLILSGILDTQTETILASLREHGVTHSPEVTTDGEWTAVIV